MKYTTGNDDELRREHVVTRCGDSPALGLFVPDHVLDFGLEKRVLVHVEATTKFLAVRKNLRRKCVTVGRHEAGFFEHRQVHVRLNVTHRARVTIPVPGAAEVAALFDDAEVVNAELAKIRCFKHSAETAANNDGVNVGNLRLTCEARFDIRIAIEFFVHACEC